MLGSLQPRALRIINAVDPSVSVSCPYLYYGRYIYLYEKGEMGDVVIIRTRYEKYLKSFLDIIYLFMVANLSIVLNHEAVDISDSDCHIQITIL